MTSIPDKIQNVLKENIIVIFSKTYCPYCTAVKNIFEKFDTRYAVIELDKHPHGNKIADAVENLTGIRTVPQVFIKGKYIGGTNKIQQLYMTGKLEKMIQSKT